MNTTYEIKYFTHNTYECSVSEAFFSFLVAPCQDETQTVKNLVFENTLQAEVFHNRNAFGFEQACLRNTQPFTEFGFSMRAVVEKKMAWFPLFAKLSQQEEEQILNSHEFFIDHHLYLGSSHYTRIEDQFKDRVLHKTEGQTVVDYLRQLNSYIYQMLEFDPEPTHVHTTVSEVLQLGRGVCQDYTHLFIGIARLNKIPCRYVSGYLNQGLQLEGSAVMHAWAEAYIPGYGWRGFDPTNNLYADVNYIKAAHGSDYSDCSPIKGLLKTTGGHETVYGVTVIPQLVAESAQ